MITCERCGFNEDEGLLHLHHLIPKSLGGKDSNGRVYLCEKCHNIWHNLLPKYIFIFIKENEKERCLQYIKIMNLRFIRNAEEI